MHRLICDLISVMNVQCFFWCSETFWSNGNGTESFSSDGVCK